MATEQKRILIAGGAGYIGSRLVPALQERGDEVTVVDLCWFGNNLPEGINLIKEDIFNLTVEDVKGYDTIIFLGGLSNDPMAEYSPALNFISNGSSPVHLAYIAKKAGVKKFIYGSSCSVYGFTDSDSVDETFDVNTEFPYGISKLQGETGVQQFADDTFSVISFRQGTLSGYSPRMRFDLFINTMYMKAATTGTITVNNPAIWRPILTIHDAVGAYIKGIDADINISGVFNIASVNKTVGGVAQEIQSHFKKVHDADITIVEKDIFDLRNYRVSTQKVQDTLGVVFKGNVASVLQELDADIGLNFDFNQEAHYNIRVFEKLPKTISLS